MKTSFLFAFIGIAVGVVIAAACGTTGGSGCTASNCNGCCSAGGQCLGGNANDACGSLGGACNACGTGQACVSGTCTSNSNQDSGNPGNDAGNHPDSGNPGQDSGHPDSGNPGQDSGNPNDGGHAIQTVFIIMMENKNWMDIEGNWTDAPYINGFLLNHGGHAEQYFGPAPGGTTVHTSEPNYLWLEAGDNFGITDDNDPSINHQSTTQHLVDLLETAGVTWTSWQEDIDGTTCPLTAVNNYAPKHNPMVFFDDVTNTNSTTAARCIQHVRPYTEFAGHLSAGTLPRYNFITPNLFDDMHGDLFGNCGTAPNCTHSGDTWLSQQVPAILSSPQYQAGGVLFILWDESEFSFTCLGSNCSIGMIVLSPFAKTSTADGGYINQIHYDHSSMLRTFQDIFGVSPYLRAAADAGNLSDFFNRFP